MALHLLDIFLTTGAPAILQSDNGAEFTAAVITEVCKLWPKLKIVHSKPRMPQSQGSLERANGGIKDMLICWMDDNSTYWTTGVKYVQFMKNSSHHTGIGMSPFKAMFGVEAKLGLRPSTLTNEVIDMTETEEDLLRTCQSEDTSAEHRDAEPLQDAATGVVSLNDLQGSYPGSSAEETAAEEDCSSSPHTTDIREETDFTESQMDSPLEFAHGSPEWVLDHSATNIELSEELSSACQPVTMNKTGSFSLWKIENDSPQVFRRDDESEHQEGRKEHRNTLEKIFDIQK